MQEIEINSCIRFVPKSHQKDYLEIIDDDGCYSYLGMRGGRQLVSLKKKGCIYKGTIMHELIHALGYG